MISLDVYPFIGTHNDYDKQDADKIESVDIKAIKLKHTIIKPGRDLKGYFMLQRNKKRVTKQKFIRTEFKMDFLSENFMLFILLTLDIGLSLVRYTFVLVNL